MIASSLLLVAPRQVAWTESELPPPGPGEILVETIVGAISVGSELPLYRGDHRGSLPAYPAMTGYESLGRVLESRDAGLAAGDRVVATYGHRTHALLAAKRAVPVPGDISDPAALLVILASDSAKGVIRIALPRDEPVLVTGGGVMGLLTVFNLVAREHVVDVVEPLAIRRDLALRSRAMPA